MKRFKLAVFAAFFILMFLPAIASAAELEYYGIESSILEGMTSQNTVKLKFSYPVSHLRYQLGFPVYNLSVESNFESDCLVAEANGGSAIICDFTGMSSEENLLEFNFEASEGIQATDDGYSFSANYGISMPIERAFIMVKLPERSGLLREPSNSSYSPPDGKTMTDGRRIMVYWERLNLTEDDPLQFSVLYSTGGGELDYTIIAAAVIVVVAIAGGVFYMKKGPGSRAIIASVLNSDEKAIVDILSRNEGKVSQKVLVRDTDFSKAKVSRLVKSLKARGVVDTEPISGREKRVILKKPGKG